MKLLYWTRSFVLEMKQFQPPMKTITKYIVMSGLSIWILPYVSKKAKPRPNFHTKMLSSEAYKSIERFSNYLTIILINY